jgi:hypothetical protein
MYDERRTRLQAAYEICPELREISQELERLQAFCWRAHREAVIHEQGYTFSEEALVLHGRAAIALAKLDKIK